MRKIFAVAAFVALFPLLPHWLNSDEILLSRDISLFFVASKNFFRESILREGQLPYWNSLTSAGMPFYADSANATLYPPNLLFLFSDVHNAYCWLVSLHIFLAFLGTFLLFRELRLSRWPATLLAVSWAWGGPLLSAHDLAHTLSAITAIPWFFFFLARYLRAPGFLRAFLLSAAVAWPLYGGEPQSFQILFLILFAALLYRKISPRRAALPMALTLLAAAAQLLPSLWLARMSNRLSVGIEEALVWSLHPARFLNIFVPGIFGDLSPSFSFWGFDFQNHGSGHFFLESIFLGTLPMALLLWGPFLLWRSRKNLGRTELGVGVLTLLSLLLCLGAFSPVNLYALFYRFLPFWSGFRYPERLSIWFLFFLLVASAALLRRLLAAPRLKERGWKEGEKYAAATALALVTLLAVFLHDKYHGLWLTARTAGFFAAYILLFHFYVAGKIRRTHFVIALFLAGALDIAPSLGKSLWFQNRSLVREENFPAVSEMRSGLAVGDGRHLPQRFLRPSTIDSDLGPTVGRLAQQGGLDYPGVRVFTQWLSLDGNIPAAFGIPNALGYLTLELAGRKKIWDESMRQSPELASDLFGIKFALKVDGDGKPSVVTRETALPVIFWARSTESHDAAADLSAKLPEAARGRILIESSSAAMNAPADLPPPEVREKTSRGLSLKIPENFPGGTLVWNESFYPFWNAYLGDARLPIRKANGWAMAVEVPADASARTLQFRFEDPWIRAGQAITLLWLLMGAAATLWRRKESVA